MSLISLLPCCFFASLSFSLAFISQAYARFAGVPLKLHKTANPWGSPTGKDGIKGFSKPIHGPHHLLKWICTKTFQAYLHSIDHLTCYGLCMRRCSPQFSVCETAKLHWECVLGVGNMLWHIWRAQVPLVPFDLIGSKSPSIVSSQIG